MPEMLSPGVYPREVDFSAYVKAQSTATFGLVGVFERGSLTEATLVTSLEDAIRKFGFANRGVVDGHFGMLSLRSFFENGGGRAYVVRVADASAAKSTVAIQDRDVTAPLDTISVTAEDEGTWGDSISAKIEASDAFPSTGFNLVILDSDGAVLETFEDLLLDASSDDYVEKRVNDRSAFVRATDLGSTSVDNLPALGTYALVGGNNGLATLASVDYTDALVSLDTADVNFVAIPGETEVAVQTATADYAEARKDCVAVLETAQGLDATGMSDHRTTLALNTSYAALYGPWLEASHPISGRKIVIPPSGIVAGIYARNDAQGAVWTAPAGLNRGTLRGVLGAEINLSKGEQDVLYQAQINPIATVARTLAVYGQKTLQIKASATDRLNVRRLMAYVEKSVVDAAQFLVFEANDARTWNSFLRTVVPFMERIKSGGGVTDFRVICDSTINTPDVVDANIMKARIQVKPTHTAEFLDVEFAIAPSGADFSEL